MSFRAMAAAFALILAAPAAIAQDQAQLPPNQDVTDLGNIEVASQRLRQQVQTFVDQAVATPMGRPLARWDKAICVGVANLESRYAEYMIDRIATVAAELGLESGEPGCKPNIMIMAAADAEALARALVRDDENGFRPVRGSVSLGAAALERFQSTQAPVRWWHVSLPVALETGEIAVSREDDPITGGAPGGIQPLTMVVRDASRTRSTTRDDLARVFIVVDVTKVREVGFRALSDYLALVSLAQIAPDVDSSRFDTVLNLFSPGANRSSGLTSWDTDYLTSLYEARRDRIRKTQQVNDILNNMVARRNARAD